MEIEPGRYLVAESGSLVTQVRAVKKQGDNLFYLVDAGFNNLARPILYGAYHPISVVPADGDAHRPMVEAVVGGPLCESGDIFTQEEGGFVAKRRLPQAAVGDYLVIERAGAYGFVMGSNYNSKPLAAEALVVDGHAHLIRAPDLRRPRARRIHPWPNGLRTALLVEPFEAFCAETPGGALGAQVLSSSASLKRASKVPGTAGRPTWRPRGRRRPAP